VRLLCSLAVAFLNCLALADVLGLDVLDRHYNSETGVLTAYRVSLIKGVLPSWVSALLLLLSGLREACLWEA
jgi:hypothetical protein